MKLKAILFDLDGVLVDSEHLWGEGAIRFYEQIGLRDIDAIEWKKQAMGRTQDEVITMLKEAFHLPQSKEELIKMKLNATAAIFEHKLKAKDGARELMEWASKRFKTAIATASPLALAERELEIAELAGVVATIVSAEEVKKGKPSPDVYLRAAEKIGVSPENCIAIEDNPRGVTAARAAGIRCIGVVDRYFSREELSAAGADPVVNTLREVVSCILRFAREAKRNPL